MKLKVRKGREWKGGEGKGGEGKGGEGKGREGKDKGEGKGREGRRREGRRREGKGGEGKGREGRRREGKGGGVEKRKQQSCEKEVITGSMKGRGICKRRIYDITILVQHTSVSHYLVCLSICLCVSV